MTSQEIQEQLAVQTEHIKEKKKLVLEDLSKVEPAVKDAQQGGRNLLSIMITAYKIIVVRPSVCLSVRNGRSAEVI